MLKVKRHEGLEAAAARADTFDQVLLCRTAVASTFVAGLELARSGTLALAQGDAFGDITVQGALAAPLLDQGAGAAPGEAVAR